MPSRELIVSFRNRVEAELRQNILPFWIEHTLDRQYGGFLGTIENDLRFHPGSRKGIVLNTRILWAFSRVFRTYPESVYLQLARRSFDYLVRHFFDPGHGGVYWTLDCTGSPLDTRKKTYAQAFAIYALAEFFEASENPSALQGAEHVFDLIEQKCLDAFGGGYIESCERDWTPSVDQRLSDVDMDEKKSMNTHLHLLEAYAALVRAKREDNRARLRLRELIRIFMDRILDPRRRHFRLFFTGDWRCRSDRTSFGHDIEGSWLLCEAADTLGDPILRKEVREAAVQMARAVLLEARDSDGAIFYEADPSGITDDNKHWWPQAEAVVGFLNACELSGEECFFDAAHTSWKFIEEKLVDRTNGEWFWQVSRQGVPDPSRYKVGQWKGPYHNSRACMETMRRLDRMLAGVPGPECFSREGA